jgi:hypothetical protein
MANVDQARVGLQKVLIRAYEEPAYQERLRTDPNGALAEFNLTTDDIELLHNTPVTMGGGDTCADTSCIISLCPCTCVVTVPGLPPPICRH